VNKIAVIPINRTMDSNIRIRLVILPLFFWTVQLGVIFSPMRVRGQVNRYSVFLCDSTTLFGRLDNGFSYYLGCSDSTSKKVEIRFVVSAGERTESNGRREIAHLVEHLAFMGTERFPQDSIVRYLTSVGLTRGNELRAYTGEYSTGYRIVINSNDSTLLANCILICRDWAQEMTLGEKAFEAQKGVILGEMRSYAFGTSGRVMCKVDELVLDNELYGYHNSALLRRKDIQEMQFQEVLNFYDKWYTPNRQALLVTGNYNVSSVESIIRREFNTLSDRHTQNFQDDGQGKWVGKLSGSNRVFLVTDPGLSRMETAVYFKRRHRRFLFGVDDGAREYVKDKLCRMLVERRFSNLPGKYGRANVSASMVENFRNSDIDMLIVQAAHWDPSHAADICLEAATELRRIQLNGFCDEELSLSRNEFLSEVENRSNLHTEISEITSLFLGEMNFPLCVVDKVRIANVIRGISVNEVNSYFQKFFDFGRNRDVVTVLPEILKAGFPVESVVHDAFRSGFGAKYVDSRPSIKTLPSQLMTEQDTRLLPDTAKAVVQHLVGKTRILFGNGAVVLLDHSHPATKKGYVEFHALSPGGANQYTGTRKFVAEHAAKIVEQSGLGVLDKFDLSDYFRRKEMTIMPAIEGESEEIYGSCSLLSFGALLEATYLMFSKVKCSPNAFNEWKGKQSLSMMGIANSDEKYFRSMVNHTVNGVHYFGPEYLDSVTIGAVEDVFRDRFSNVNDFIFYVSGDVVLDDKTMGLLEKYIGNIPSGVRVEDNRPLESFDTDGRMNIRLECGEGDRALVNLYLPCGRRGVDSVEVDVAMSVLEICLKEILVRKLRTQEGAVYMPDVYLNRRVLCDGTLSYRFVVSFDCDPELVDYLVYTTLAEFTRLEAVGPAPMDFKVGKSHLLSPYSSDIYDKGREVVLKDMSLEQIRLIARCYLTDEFLQQFLLVPKKWGAQGR
jgi:zinc protease